MDRFDRQSKEDSSRSGSSYAVRRMFCRCENDFMFFRFCRDFYVFNVFKNVLDFFVIKFVQ